MPTHPQQLVLFPFVPAKRTPLDKRAIRAEAHDAGVAAYHAWFRLRAREFGGVNDRNRAQITSEAQEYGERAAERVYRQHGYRDCTNQCGRLASPGYVTCPNCTER